MRRNEIWGLRMQDIKTEDGICYFDVTPHEKRKLKTKTSKRRVPIHSALLDEVLSYIESRPDDGDTLFKHRADNDAFGKYFGRINVHRTRKNLSARVFLSGYCVC